MVLKVDVPPALVRGDVDEGYGPVADAFRRNFAERGDLDLVAGAIALRDALYRIVLLERSQRHN